MFFSTPYLANRTMVQHNIYLQSSQSPYFAFEENPIPFGRSKAKQLKEIGRQCFAIARLSTEDWQNIGLAISPIATSSVRPRIQRQFLPFPSRFSTDGDRCQSMFKIVCPSK
jgi:hypothetical protein